MAILEINKLALDLVAKDFSDGHTPKANNGGPTKTARALAIIHLAARDAYAKVTGVYPPRLAGLANKPAGMPSTDDFGTAAVVGAGIRAATLLYPDFADFISDQSATLTLGLDANAMAYGCVIGEKWVASRQGDGSALPQVDAMYSDAAGHHRPDPISRMHALGRTFGQCPPSVLKPMPIALTMSLSMAGITSRSARPPFANMRWSDCFGATTAATSLARLRGCIIRSF